MSAALKPGSGTGTSVVAAVSADAVAGYALAKLSTTERTASGASCVGGCDGAGAWKSEGCFLSVGGESC